ncbi:hypothetical protein M9H77_11725 [Catharanthus roseus]|uniref:Uncharacterized protein n=1 Tax=Catharanthus roseus TaxID=4058 RepID=A0ACC0BFE4_CATRO|nr:hypothetical protein M9H77_11725 [Catharanthus roseus]
MSSNFGLFIFMEEDHSWMFRKTVPRFMEISSEFQLAYYTYEEAPNPEAQWFYNMQKFVDTPLYEGCTKTKEVPMKSQSLQATDLVDEDKMEKKSPSHSKIKSLKTLKALALVE